MRIRPPRRRGSSYAFVTMSDIAFILLIFLVLLAAGNEDRAVDLPDFSRPGKAGFSEQISLELGLDALCELDGRVLRREDLAGELEPFRGSGRVVKVSADENLPYAEVDAVLAILTDLGLRDVFLAMEKKSGD